MLTPEEVVLHGGNVLCYHSPILRAWESSMDRQRRPTTLVSQAWPRLVEGQLQADVQALARVLQEECALVGRAGFTPEMLAAFRSMNDELCKMDHIAGVDIPSVIRDHVMTNTSATR